MERNGQPHSLDTKTVSKHAALVLRCIHQKRSVNGLISEGLLYSQMAKLISHLLDENLIEYGSDDNLLLTRNGLKHLFELDAKKDSHAGGWIEPLENMRIEKLSIFDIYVPRRSVLSTLRKH